MKGTLVRQLEAQGYQARIVSNRRLYDLRQTIERFRKQGLFDEGFYQERLAGFVFRPPENFPEAQSLIILAFKDPQVRFYFNWRGTRMPVMVPPTYLHWQEKDRQAERLLSVLLGVENYRVTPAIVPKKLLAVCSGLAAYGKNNITYIEGMGSFHRLAAFYSDLPCEQDGWREPNVMERCAQCLNCLRGCSTGAIEPERFLLRAERCITFQNEKPGQVAFPDWIEGSCHNCLMGCMHCQSVCPENRSLLDWHEEGAEFSEEETGLLLEGLPLTQLPAALVEKLEHWDLLESLDILPRNLSVLLDERDSTD